MNAPTEKHTASHTAAIRPTIAFFGTPQFVTPILDELAKASFLPSLIVTAPDRPRGRGLALTPPPIKTWADHHAIRVIQPQTLKGPEALPLFLAEGNTFDLFIVAGYGNIIPQPILDMPAHGVLNVHPSLLPRYRGPAPVEGQILAGDERVGVSIIVLDGKIDHGPIVAQQSLPMPDPLPRTPELDALLWPLGGNLLARILPEWIAGTLQPIAQDHSRATFTKKFSKADGLLDIQPDETGKVDSDPIMNFRKIRAYDPWPGTYFFTEKNNKKIRIIITDAELKAGKLFITRIVPEGRSEMAYRDFYWHV